VFLNANSWLKKKKFIKGAELTKPEYSALDYWNMEHFKLPPPRKILYSFREKEEVSKWRVLADSDLIGVQELLFMMKKLN
jgi:hypothetical protein